MKFSALMLSWLSGPLRERNLRPFFAIIALFVFLIAIYSTAFHFLMAAEGQEYSWATGIYWTVVTMSTLGYGDIVFTSGVGQLFSVVVLLSGSALILVLLPFTFIQFVFMPWMERRAQRRTPRQLAPDTSGHLILTSLGPIEQALITRARRAHVEYVVVISDVAEANAAADAGYRVMIGDLDDPATYVAARADNAALVLATHDDAANANISFTARGVTHSPIVATADTPSTVDVLHLAGTTEVLELGPMLGRSLAQRVLAPDGTAHVLARRGDLVIAEMGATRSPLAGLTLGESAVRQRTGATVLGSWVRGGYAPGTATTVVDRSATLILAGTDEHLATFNATFAADGSTGPSHPYVIILGAGRVGRALAAELTAAGVDHLMVERNPDRDHDDGERYVRGDAADLRVLEQAGLYRATAVAVTTHDDDVNVYLALYIRKLLPEVELLCRSNLDRNVATLYRAGADSVLSYASAGADATWNAFRGDDTLMLAEGLEMFTLPITDGMVGRTLADLDFAHHTGCSVVAIMDGTEVEVANPGASDMLPPGRSLLLIGTSDAEDRAHEIADKMVGRSASARRASSA